MSLAKSVLELSGSTYEARRDEEEFADILAGILMGQDEVEIEKVLSFREAGVLTRDAGVVVTLADGREYQITVVRSN